MTAKDHLINLYSQIRKTKTYNDKGMFSHSVIEIKKDNEELLYYNQSIYQDIKRFITGQVITIEKRDYGYDVLNIQKIIKSITYLSKLEEQYALFHYTYRILKNNQFEKEAELVISKMKRIKLKLILEKENSKIKYIKFLWFLISYSWVAALIMIFSLFTTFYFITFPVMKDDYLAFIIKETHYIDCYPINHLYNIIAYLLGMSNSDFLTPINWKGISILLFSKALYITYITGFLYKTITDQLKLNK